MANRGRGGRGRGRGRGGHNNNDNRMETDDTSEFPIATQQDQSNRKKRRHDEDETDFFDIPENSKKQRTTENEQSKSTDKPTAPQDCDIFIGTFEHLTEVKHFLKVKNWALQRPNLLLHIPTNSSNFPEDEVDKQYKCRNLVLSLNPEFYNNDTTVKLFSETFDLKAKSKKDEITTRIANEIAKAKQFYNPKGMVFIEIIDRIPNDGSDFKAILAFICAKYRYQPLQIDSLNRKTVIEHAPDERAQAYVKSLKWSFRVYHPDASINMEINKLPVNKIIDLNEL